MTESTAIEEATRLGGESNGTAHKPLRILFIGHDASRTGAPILLLNLVRWLLRSGEARGTVLLCDGGPLAEAYHRTAPTTVLSDLSANSALPIPLRSIPLLRRLERAVRHRSLRRRLKAGAFDLIYANTVATAAGLRFLADWDIPVLVHVHELEVHMRCDLGRGRLAPVFDRANHFIGASDAVCRNLIGNHAVGEDAVDRIYEFLDLEELRSAAGLDTGRDVRAELGIPEEALIVGGAGTTDWRKGTDLFVQLARIVQATPGGRPVHFLWIGGQRTGEAAQRLRWDAEQAGAGNRFHLLGTTDRPMRYLSAIDVFALVSREDPYPLVMLEAAFAGKPVVCFAGSGGSAEFVGSDCGFVVPYLDLPAFGDAILKLMGSSELRDRLGENGRRKAAEHDIRAAGPQIVEVMHRLAGASNLKRDMTET